MSTMRDDDFENERSEIELRHRLKRLQEITCDLLSRNEELRARVRELERLQTQART